MDSRDSNVQQNHPTLCRNGCGFYSNAGNEGLCSVCYKDIVKKKQAPPTNMPSSLGPAPGSMASLSIDESSSGAVALPSNSSHVHMGGANASPSLDTGTPTVPVITQNPETEKSSEDRIGGMTPPGSTVLMDSPSKDDNSPKDGKKKKNRCVACKKKVGLTGFTCRCGGLFCSIHRYSDKHECNFDYKALGAEEISKSNPVVVAEKVSKI